MKPSKLPFRPMLSASLDGVDLSTLRYPLLLSPKIDGVRCIVWEGVAFSRNGKPLRNHFVQTWASDKHNLDGELIVGSPTDPLLLNKTQSGVMSFDGEPDFTFMLFDAPEGYREFMLRHGHVVREQEGVLRIRKVAHYQVRNPTELLAHEAPLLELGYEGVMLRDPNGPYKNGRSTLKEGYLMKLKRFIDGEAVVVALEESQHNTNEAQMNELGYTKRSTAKLGKVGAGMVGAILVEDPKWGVLRLSPGVMTHAERAAHWANNGSSLIGERVHWRAFGVGVKDKPRFPRFYGVRPDGV